MMPNRKDIMNKERLEKILKIRKIRNNLDNLNITLEEKEILRKTLNYYENELNLEIERSNNNIEEYDNYDIPNENQEIKIPEDDSINKYKEYAIIDNNNLLSNVENLINNITNFNLSEDDNKIILNCLKEYCLYLKELEIKKQNSDNYLKEELNITK